MNEYKTLIDLIHLLKLFFDGESIEKIKEKILKNEFSNEEKELIDKFLPNIYNFLKKCVPTKEEQEISEAEKKLNEYASYGEKEIVPKEKKQYEECRNKLIELIKYNKMPDFFDKMKSLNISIKNRLASQFINDNISTDFYDRLEVFIIQLTPEDLEKVCIEELKSSLRK